MTARVFLRISHFAIFALLLTACSETRRTLVATFSGAYDAGSALPLPPPTYDGPDATRTRIPVALTMVAAGLKRPTDIQFDPSRPDLMIVLEQEGAMKWFDLAAGTGGLVKEYPVLSVSEQGLLGMAFHPAFPERPLVYLNMTVRRGDMDVSRILEVTFAPPADLRKATIESERIVLDVEQPYQNHNAGQLAFGPDGYLYIGWGDGGWAGDPHDHGQNPMTMLGSMLRIDPAPSEELPYTIPPDNPFVDSSGVLPETWAIGLRNPWRYSFDPTGRLVVADVGQNAWEEISIIERGGNYGWRTREGRHCYDPAVDCERADLLDPIYEYSHDEGESITGGYVCLAGNVPALKGLYVFGDFVSGRLWALPLPAESRPTKEMPEVFTLGRWQILVSTFGRDTSGRIYLAEFGNGAIFRIDPTP
jgi:glucose/arabinose dehydrogenase